MIFYVSGAYSAPTAEGRLANVNEAIRIGLELAKRGHIPFIPHLLHFVDEIAKKCQCELTWSDYMVWDLALLDKCDALFLCNRSPGADIEHGMARLHGKLCFHDLEDVPEGPLTFPKSN